MPDIALEREAIALFERLLDLPERERENRLTEEAGERSELRSRVGAMIAADRRARLRTGAAIDEVEEEAVPERIGAYRIVERIGVGGMGSVYRGERVTGDFAHLAAIKVIKPGLLSEALVERFRRERQLLATLSHPHIAQLYDGGETDGGSPYFVMEYVDGLPLLQWVEEEAPPRAERARLFRDVCGAVAFAHRNLVVHRDLTPSNVLVTRDGVVKLIDFGIARPADAEGAAREAPSIGSLSLTPGYAAPERMASGEVTTAADIYSLGKLLQKLIPPGPGDGELKAIVARAAAADPLERYPTADALAADVAAWQEGFPVSAAAGGRRYRLAKFVGRHRLGVAAGALALLLLLGAFALTLLANARAEAARVEAEHRFAETRRIARALLFETFDAVSRVPGSTDARAHLARTGLAYLEALAGDRDAPPDVRIEVGLGYLRLAQVVGGGQASQLGRYEDANALLAKAAGILSALHAERPDDPDVRRAMAALLVEQSGTNLYNNNATDLARDQARRAQALLRSTATSDPEAARLYADAIRAEGDTFLWTDGFAEARALHLAGERFISGLPQRIRDMPGMMSVRAGNFRLLGEAHHKLREAEPARLALDRAVEINRALVRAAPDDPLLRRRLVISLRYRAVVHRTNRRREPARESIAEASEGARWLRDRDRSDAGAIHLFAVVREVHAQILGDLGRHAESFAVGEEVLAAHRELVRRAGNAPGALRSMAQALRTDGGNHYNGRDYAGACRLWGESLAIFVELDRRGSLADGDRTHSMREMQDYVARACDPPRPALGARI